MGKTITGNLLSDTVISPDESIGNAMSRLDKVGTGALVLCKRGRVIYGLLTDGDIRRGILKGKSLEDPCGTIANRSPIFAKAPVSPAEALRLMEQHDIHHLPLVDDDRKLLDFLLRKNLVWEEGIEEADRLRLEKVIIDPNSTIAEAIARMDKAGTGALVLCSTGRKLSGLLTDGDVRRAILRGTPLETTCGKIGTMNPVTVRGTLSPREALHLMNQHDVNHLPIVDAEGNIVEFRLRKEIAGRDGPGISAVIMAGGFGKRLLPMTEHVPKPMLPVGDRPLLELTIQQLRRSGIREVNLTTHYLPENIVNHFGDGEAFGVRLNYIKEDHPLGTAGGLKLMKRLDEPFLVINGDILTGVSFHEMLDYHKRHQADITVGVRKYDVKVPFGVVECEDARITQLREKPSLTFFINAGVYLLEPSVCDFIPDGQRFDMTDLIQKLMDVGRSVVSFPIMEYWLDMGNHTDYLQAQDDVRNGKI